jgi:hypothetical protein
MPRQGGPPWSAWRTANPQAVPFNHQLEQVSKVRRHCRIDPYLDQGGAAASAPRSRSGLRRPGRRTPSRRCEASTKYSTAIRQQTGCMFTATRTTTRTESAARR